MDAKTLSDSIRAKARSLGADLVGIAPALLPEASGGPQAYREWIENGMHATMAYMARDPQGRDSITRWFPAAKSVVLLGFSYAGQPPLSGPDEPSGTGRVARYAVSKDYHDTLKHKLKELLAWIREQSAPISGKFFVDSSPVLERLYARYAGLGWVGKNTLLIHPKLGSFFFLTGLALDRELEADEPLPDHCGKCNRCVESCPTDAFPQARVLDASRCIAYLTIEHRGPIPEGLREGTGDWIFGCDICQDVCPWNRFSRPNPLFSPQIPQRLELESVAALSDTQFDERFAQTPVERAGRRGLVRNALLAMGNSGDPAHRPQLEKFAEDHDPMLAEQARWSLARLGRIA